MTCIFLLSDTHSHWNNEWVKYFKEADEIWHAGDIGNETIIQHITKYSANKPLRIVYGNIDNSLVRMQTKPYLCFALEGFQILITHNAGPFGKYNTNTKQCIQTHHPHLLICGHSHILKVKWDKFHNLWYINPGAAGLYGSHKISSALLFELHQQKIQNMQIIQWTKEHAG